MRLLLPSRGPRSGLAGQGRSPRGRAPPGGADRMQGHTIKSEHRYIWTHSVRPWVRKIHTYRHRHMWSPRSHRHTPTHATDKLGHTVTRTQNQVKSMETCQGIDTGRHTGTHQEPHANTQVSRCIQLTDTHTDTNMPSDVDTKADWDIHRYADAQRRSHMQTQPHAQKQTYPQRQAHLFLEQNPGNLPISPTPQRIDLIYPPIHCPPIYLSSHPLTQLSTHLNLLLLLPPFPFTTIPAGPLCAGRKQRKLPGTQSLTLPTSIQGRGMGHSPLGSSGPPDSYASHPP